MVDIIHGLSGQGPSLLGQLVDFQLKLGEHGLAENSSSKLLQIMVNQVMDFIFVFCVLQQVFNQQVFIDRAGYLCHKNAVIAVNIGLGAARIQGVHRVPAFMGQGKNAVEVFLIVHQNIRVGAIDPGGISAGGFALIFINIYPAGFNTLLKFTGIILAQRRQRIDNDFFSLLPIQLHFWLWVKWHIKVVHS